MPRRDRGQDEKSCARGKTATFVVRPSGHGMHACICGMHFRIAAGIPSRRVMSRYMESALPAGDDRTRESSRAAAGVGLPGAVGLGAAGLLWITVVGAEAENSHCPYLLLTADRSEAYDRLRRQSNGDAG